MNTSFFKSWYLLITVALIGIFIAIPSSLHSSTYTLLSGWVSFLLLIIVFLYTVRKRLYQLKLSPETRFRVPLKKLERAEARFNAIRGNIRQGNLKTKREIEQVAHRVLKEEQVQRVLRIEVVPNPSSPKKGTGKGTEKSNDPFSIQVFPTEPLGRVSVWLRAHLYLGFAFGVIVLFHGGGSFDSITGWSLNLLTLIVVLTGIVGIFLFSLGPSWITEKEKDLPYEKAFVYRQSLTEKILEIGKGLPPALEKLSRELANHPKQVAQKLPQLQSPSIQLDPQSQKSVQDLLVLLSQRERVSGALESVWKIKFAINFWRWIHIPASVLLMGLVFIHIYSVWRF